MKNAEKNSGTVGKGLASSGLAGVVVVGLHGPVLRVGGAEGAVTEEPRVTAAGVAAVVAGGDDAAVSAVVVLRRGKLARQPLSRICAKKIFFLKFGGHFFCMCVSKPLLSLSSLRGDATKKNPLFAIHLTNASIAEILLRSLQDLWGVFSVNAISEL